MVARTRATVLMRNENLGLNVSKTRGVPGEGKEVVGGVGGAQKLAGNPPDGSSPSQGEISQMNHYSTNNGKSNNSHDDFNHSSTKSPAHSLTVT